jgi:hypothetical protein
MQVEKQDQMPSKVSQDVEMKPVTQAPTQQ